jgi:hypothetical protein
MTANPVHRCTSVSDFTGLRAPGTSVGGVAAAHRNVF